MPQTISDKFINGLPTPAKGNKIYWDDKIIGFGIRITAAGSKAFILRYTINGLERRYTIGQFGKAPGFNTTAARAKVEEIKGKIASGKNKFDPSDTFDPLQAKENACKAATVKQLGAEYLSKYAHVKKRATSVRSDEHALTGIILSLIHI